MAPELQTIVDDAYMSQLRQQMLKFACLQLRDEHLAEDAVQEALIGAIKNIGDFRHRSALKSWVFGILKHKIADVLRQRQRQLDFSELDETETMLEQLLFDSRGHWNAGEQPQHWQSPQQSAVDENFWQIFEACLENLPEAQARLFMMREFIELDSEEICQLHDISLSNLYVMLYRARLRLRECLEIKWFQEAL
ncbi:sigma-70 family RNA polymerase sigma factor [Shewanella yunxiaonensis]|uniref:Sigma-70 family RNA polymerase sigma factor n=1 Tax=Shewanella yunxiaonensis TaxID=2829809 RepID=A0ABX7YV57_9GAMM|nr:MULTISPECIES: sigma-70 family RNA polymerase sigma factor [Shewanella]MDF0534956.1 sigma-70 family RNA polymerase sigma factor [Shewanella sp. A32]QUN06230.1 sigma-70 family RNA polymerase sigma factor [Shewanella yunxiaonensis]